MEHVRLLRRATCFEIAVDPVGRDLHEAAAASADVLEQDLDAVEVRVPELLGGENGTVDMRLGGEVDDRVAAVRGARNVLGLGDVAVVELDLVREVGTIARVRQLVEDDDLVTRGEQPLDEMRADE